MKNVVFLASLVFFCFFILYLESEKLSDTKGGITGEMQKEKQGINRLLEEWVAAVKTSDVEKLASLVTEDAEFWTHKVAPLVGRQAVKEVFKSFFAQFKADQEFKCQELIIIEEWAFARGMEINRLTPVTEGEPAIQRQRAFSVMKKGSDGRWRFARGMTNLPPDN